MVTEAINKKLDFIENEITSLKSIVIKVIQQQKPKKILHLKGILEGTSVTEKDIKKAKNSLFRVGM